MNVIGTALFVVSASLSAVFFTPVLRTLGVAVALLLFATGIASFIWGYFTAVQRSRCENISVASLFFLSGNVADRKIRWLMNGCLAIQALCGLITSLARTTTAGSQGSTLAFGVLVPLFGMGINGLWASRHGSFEARADSQFFTQGPAIGKDGDHG